MSEYRPTEYVVDFGDCRSNQFVRLSMALIELVFCLLVKYIQIIINCQFVISRSLQIH